MESFVDLVKTPLKLLMYCLVLYVAAQSAVVGFFVFIAFASVMYHRIKKIGSTIPAAPKVSMPDYPSKSKAQAQPPVEPVAPAYEGSAVVTPIRRAGSYS